MNTKFISERTFRKNLVNAENVIFGDNGVVSYCLNGYCYYRYYSDYEQGFVSVRRKCRFL